MRESVVRGAVVAVVCLAAPWLAIHAARRVRALDTLGPVVLCYLAGIALGPLVGVRSDAGAAEVADLLQIATVAVAIPLLLLGTDLRSWIRLAGPTVLSFIVAVGAVVATVLVLAPRMSLPDDPAIVGGMTTAVFSGGTANLAAVGTALDVDQDAFVAIATADVLVGGIHLLLLLTVARPLLSRVLRPPPVLAAGGDPTVAGDDPGTALPTTVQAVRSLGIGLAIVVLAAGATFAVVAGSVDGPVLDADAFSTGVILAITTLGLGLSAIRRLRETRGTYATGQYLFLVFAVAIGTLVDLPSLVTSLTQVVPFLAAVLAIAVTLHVAVAKVLGLDHDTVIITSTAAVFGPPFVGPVAAALRNPDIVPSGMTTGVVGLAVGNYVGFGVAALLR